MNTDANRLESHRRLLQTIVAALIAGVIVFATLSLLIVDMGKFNFGWSPLAILSAAVLPISVVASVLVPRFVIRNAANSFAERHPKPDADAVLAASLSAITSATIVGPAIREAAAFLGLVVWIVESNAIGLTVGGIALATMVLAFPTGFQIERQLEEFRSAISQR